MSESITEGHLKAARSAGAHDQFVAFVAEYPESDAAETLLTAISLDALDEFESIAGSFVGALWRGGAAAATNPDKVNEVKMREFFDEMDLPEWMQEAQA